MHIFDIYRELKRSGKKLMDYTDPMNGNTHIEIWSIDGSGYKITKYCDYPYVAEKVNIDNYIPKIGGF